MKRRVYRVVRNLHLYFGLFISPFVVVFALSVFWLVHPRLPQGRAALAAPQTVSDLPVPPGLEALSGRPRVEALRPVLERAGVHGEVGWIQHLVKERRLIIPVEAPGRVTTVTLDLAQRQAIVERRSTGLIDATVMLHKSPGPHLVDLRMNWFPMRLWRWLADTTVYLALFLSASGVYLWYALRVERKVGLALLAAGAVSFFGIVYALCG